MHIRDWKIPSKLLVGFAIMVVLTLIVSGFGYIGMHNMDRENGELYTKNFAAVDSIGNMRTNLQQQRVTLRSFMLYDTGSNLLETAKTDLQELELDMQKFIQEYKETLDTDEFKEQFEKFEELYTNDFTKTKSIVSSHIKVSDPATALQKLEEADQTVREMGEILALCYNDNIDMAQSRVQENARIFNSFGLCLIAIILISAIGAVFLTMYQNRVISRPLYKLVDAANAIAGGDMEVEIEVTQSKDEIGLLVAAFRKLVEGIKQQAGFLMAISTGDLTVEPKSQSDRDMVGRALEEVTSSLNHVAGEIKSVASQVAIGANQLSEGGQALSQGASQQATAIEELSSSIFEISLITKENAKMAGQASQLYGNVKQSAQDSSALMSEMLQAVEAINHASADISKIIKLIDDISFQTNILSLNAAVEAANAGQHGKGFAVVANEVRNLAAKSSQAAKDTDVLIDNSLSKAQLGASIADKTHKALEEIVESILESSQLIDDIAKSSEEQSLAIEQINIGIDQLAQVVNQNSTSAEKSAMAAEEMATQASMMEKLLSKFKLNRDSVSQDIPEQQIEEPRADIKPVIIHEDNDFGKY